MNIPSKPLRFGVIGCGTISYWYHLRELQKLPGAKLLAIADPDPAARQRARAITSAPALADPEELLCRGDLDAVVVSGPTHLNASLAISAARAGKHVYIEKPAAITPRDALELEQAVRQAGVRAMVGFNRRYHPLCIEARKLVAAGAIGAVRSVLSTFCEPLSAESMPAWKRRRATGGGVLLDLASHHVDLLRWFLNDEISRVNAGIASLLTEDDQAWLELSTCSGIESRGFFSFRAARADWLEFIGENGSLRVDRHRARLSLRVSRRFGYGTRSAFNFPPAQLARWWAMRLVRPSYEPSYRLALRAFIASITKTHTMDPFSGVAACPPNKQASASTLNRGKTRALAPGEIASTIEEIASSATQPATLDDSLRSVNVLFAAEESARLVESLPFRLAHPKCES